VTWYLVKHRGNFTFYDIDRSVSELPWVTSTDGLLEKGYLLHVAPAYLNTMQAFTLSRCIMRTFVMLSFLDSQTGQWLLTKSSGTVFWSRYKTHINQVYSNPFLLKSVWDGSNTQSESYFIFLLTLRQSVSQSVRPSWFPATFCIHGYKSASSDFFFWFLSVVGRPPWWEDGSVV